MLGFKTHKETNGAIYKANKKIRTREELTVNYWKHYFGQNNAKCTHVK